MKFANNGSFLYYVGAGNGGKGSYKIGSNSITYSVRTYEEGSLEKGTIKVIKGKNIRLRRDMIFIRFTGRRNKSWILLQIESVK